MICDKCVKSMKWIELAKKFVYLFVLNEEGFFYFFFSWGEKVPQENREEQEKNEHSGKDDQKPTRQKCLGNIS